MTLAASSLTRVSRKVSAKHCQQTLLAFFLAAFTISCDEKRQSQNVESRPKRFQTVTINNIEPRRDVAGEIIDAHDGCLQFFKGRFYLYGTAYGKTDGLTNNSYHVYSSPDLERWTLEGELLKERPDGIYFRPYVVFNPNTRKYVLWYNWYSNSVPWIGHDGVAISDTPIGPFKIVNSNAQLAHASPGDGSLFVDDDGTGYFIYTAMGEGYTIQVERLTPDYLGSSGEISSILAAAGEAPVLFRRNNLYYALSGPRCAFCPWGSEVQVFTATSPLGPFSTKPQWNINRRPQYDVPTLFTQETNGIKVPAPEGTFTLHPKNSTFINTNNLPIIPAQQTWVARIPMSGEPLFIWMADRWESSPDGIKGHDFQFWSAPLKFSPDGDILPIENIGRWNITWAWGD